MAARCYRMASGDVELQSEECQSLQRQGITMTTGGTKRPPARRHIDVISASRRSSAATSNNDDDYEDDENFDDKAVTSRHVPASYLRHARMSICKMTSDYIRRLPGSRSRKDRSATRRERKATKTLAIVLGQHISYRHSFTVLLGRCELIHSSSLPSSSSSSSSSTVCGRHSR